MPAIPRHCHHLAAIPRHSVALVCIPPAFPQTLGRLGSLVGSSHTRERNWPSSALSAWSQAGGSEKLWVSWPAALKLSVSPWVGVGLQSCPGTAPDPPSPLSHMNITIWSLNTSLGLREFAETLQGLERPHICCPGTEKCLSCTEPCSSPALLKSQRSALCQVLSCFTGMRNVLALATMEGRGMCLCSCWQKHQLVLGAFCRAGWGSGDMCCGPRGT